MTSTIVVTKKSTVDLTKADLDSIHKQFLDELEEMLNKVRTTTTREEYGKEEKSYCNTIVCVIVTLSFQYFLGDNISNNRSSRRYKRNLGLGKYDIIRISESVRRDLQFIKGIVGLMSNVPDGDVVDTLVKMFKQKKIGQLIEGKNYKISLDLDLVAFFNEMLKRQ